MLHELVAFEVDAELGAHLVDCLTVVFVSDEQHLGLDCIDVTHELVVLEVQLVHLSLKLTLNLFNFPLVLDLIIHQMLPLTNNLSLLLKQELVQSQQTELCCSHFGLDLKKVLGRRALDRLSTCHLLEQLLELVQGGVGRHVLLVADALEGILKYPLDGGADRLLGELPTKLLSLDHVLNSDLNDIILQARVAVAAAEDDLVALVHDLQALSLQKADHLPVFRLQLVFLHEQNADVPERDDGLPVLGGVRLQDRCEHLLV